MGLIYEQEATEVTETSSPNLTPLLPPFPPVQDGWSAELFANQLFAAAFFA